MEWDERLVHSRRAALVIVDVQNDYCHPEGVFGKYGANLEMIDAMTKRTAALLASARQAQIPIVWIRTNHEDATDSEAWRSRIGPVANQVCRTGTWGADFFGVSPQEEEIVVNKHRYSAFIHTRLESVLRTLKVDTLIILGVSTNVCVESTARDGYMLDYHIVLVEDCCASYSPESHQATIVNINDYFGVVVTAEQLMAAWSALPSAGRKKGKLQHV